MRIELQEKLSNYITSNSMAMDMEMSQCSSLFPWVMDGDYNVSRDISRGSTLDPSVTFCKDCKCNPVINGTLNRTADGQESSFLCDEFEMQTSPALSEDLCRITESPELCDVQFMVGPNRVPLFGVKAIIAVRNRLLHQMIEQQVTTRLGRNSSKMEWFIRKLGSMKRSTRKSRTGRITPTYHVVEVTEFETEIFQPLLSYIHCGTGKITLRNVIGLLNAAETYNVPDLRTLCIRFVESSLRLSTVLKILKYSEPFGNRRVTKIIINKTVDFIADRAADVFLLEEFVTLSKLNIALIFSRCDLKALESEKWDAALRWSKRHSHKKGNRYLRRTMKMFCRRIEFENIPLTKLLTEVQPLAVLSDDVIKILVQQHRLNRHVIGGDSPAPMKPPRTRFAARSSQNLGVSVLGKRLLESRLDVWPQPASSTPKKILLSNEKLDSYASLK